MRCGAEKSLAATIGPVTDQDGGVKRDGVKGALRAAGKKSLGALSLTTSKPVNHISDTFIALYLIVFVGNKSGDLNLEIRHAVFDCPTCSTTHTVTSKELD